MSLLGEARYGIASAPTGLGLVQELLNTVAVTRWEQPDLFDHPLTAGQWLRELRVTAEPGLAASTPAPELSLSEMRKLRSLRSSLVEAVSGTAPSSVHANVRIEMTAGGEVRAAFSELPVPWLLSAVLMEVLLAQQSGDWRRLKICAHPHCDVSFYDRSKNRSAVWHDVRTCGNAVNLRASRSRRRAQSPDPDQTPSG